MANYTSIILIGMPGAGKSSVGVLLARLAGLRFVDTDLDIQVRAGATLEEILQRDGYRQLRRIEEEVLLDTALDRAVVATGGSAVYSERAMARLKGLGPVVYLRADIATLGERVSAGPPRGIASDSAHTLADIHAERTPLYAHFADCTVDADRGSAEEVAAAVLARLEAEGWTRPDMR